MNNYKSDLDNCICGAEPTYQLVDYYQSIVICRACGKQTTSLDNRYRLAKCWNNWMEVLREGGGEG